MNCRDIPPATWEHTRQALSFYFSRRLRMDRAEDLAQETMLRVWTRTDFEFERPEDFSRVCYGFAHRVCREFCRDEAQRAEVEPSADISAPDSYAGGPRAAEAAILLRETLEIGRAEMREDEWRVLRKASGLDELNTGEAQGIHDRVTLHRARKKLARLIGRTR